MICKDILNYTARNCWGYRWNGWPILGQPPRHRQYCFFCHRLFIINGSMWFRVGKKIVKKNIFYIVGSVMKGYVRVNCWYSQTPKAVCQYPLVSKFLWFDRHSSIRVRDTQRTCSISHNRSDKMLRWCGVSGVSSEVNTWNFSLLVEPSISLIAIPLLHANN